MRSPAIHRSKPTAPLLWLLQNGHIQGKVLDFGCGYGMDVKWLKNLGHDSCGFDSAHFPGEKHKQHKFDTITCQYVLNTVKPKVESKVLKEIQKLLAKGGKAFITVRRDIPVEGKQGRGCWQRWVECPKDWVVVEENAKFAIFSYQKDEKPPKDPPKPKGVASSKKNTSKKANLEA